MRTRRTTFAVEIKFEFLATSNQMVASENASYFKEKQRQREGRREEAAEPDKLLLRFAAGAREEIVLTEKQNAGEGWR